MGQKASPIAVRLRDNKQWQSRWFSEKNYQRQLLEDIQLRRFIIDRIGQPGVVAGVIIERRGEQQTTVNIQTGRPGVIIGRSGKGTLELKKTIDRKFQFKPNQLKINILEIKNPDAVASLLANEITQQITRRLPYRRVAKKIIERAMTAGAKGVRVILSGRVGGVEIARTERFEQGSIPTSTLREKIDFAVTAAQTTYGTIGIKVYLYMGRKDVDAKKT